MSSQSQKKVEKKKKTTIYDEVQSMRKFAEFTQNITFETKDIKNIKIITIIIAYSSWLNKTIPALTKKKKKDFIFKTR